MMKQVNKQTEIKENKKRYTRPLMQRLGSLRELTTGGSTGSNDMNGSQTAKP